MSDRLSWTPRRHWGIWGGITVVFLCGLLVGSVATTAYHDYQGQQKWERGLAGLKPRVMRHLQHELRLSAEQQQTIEPIIARAEGELLRLRMAQQPRVEEILGKTIEVLRTQLNPEQQSKLDELSRQLQRRWEADRQHIHKLNSGGRD